VKRLVGLLSAFVLGVTLVAVPATEAHADDVQVLGWYYISGGRATGRIVHYNDHTTYASLSAYDVCPGDGHWIGATVQIDVAGPNLERAFANTRGHSCGFGDNDTGYEDSSIWLDHRAARLKLCRYPTGSWEPSSCVYSRWFDNFYDD